LPPEIAAQVHPDRRRNEEEYWAVRDQLVEQYRGQWVGFANGRVIASGTSPVAVFHEAEKSGLHPFLICVGREDFAARIRRTTFGYDSGYPGEPLPLMSVEYRTVSGSTGTVFDRVIPDTGADTSVLPWSDCQLLQLNLAMGAQGLISGVTGHAVATLAFQIFACLDGHDYSCRVHADFAGSERILGRDVLNQLEVLFRGPASEVIVNP
jgi:hypothetical protein